MARKSGRTTNAGASATPASSTNDHDSSHKQSQKQPRIEQPGNGFTNTTTNHPTQAKGPLANTHRSSCSAEEGNEGSSDDDAAKADGEDDEDAQSDALAPSGRTTIESGDHAGHLVAEFEKHAPIEKSLNNGGGGPEIRRPTPKEAGVSRRTAATESEGCDSDKEAYDGVDDISDTDEGEPDVEKLEEKRIIELAEGGDAVSEAGASDIWEGFEIDNGLFMSDVPYFDEQYGRTDQGILDSEMELFQNTSVFDDLEEPMPSLPQPKLPPRRRVHFREPVLPPSSETSDVISDDEDLNGLFNSSLGQDTGGGQTLSRVRQGNSEDEGEDDSSGGNSSGYETDYGDTTDEEDVLRPATTCPQSLIRKPPLSSVEANSNGAQVTPSAGRSAAPSPFKVPTTPSRYRPGPRMGSFKANPTKPYAMIDCTGDNIVITPAKRPARVNGTLSQMASTRASTANASPVVSQPTLATKTDVDFSDFSNRAAIDPMLAPGSKAMADILRPVGRTTQSQRSSHASSMSVFFPMDSLHDVNALYASDDEVDEDQDDEDNDGGNLLDFEDLIDYDVISSDDDDLAPDTSLPTPTSASVLDQSTHTQPKTPSPQTPSTDELMAHFDKGVIGAFRQGQNQHQHQSHPQAFRSGRQGLTNSLSPSSKRKMSGGFAPAGALEPFPKRRLVHHG